MLNPTLLPIWHQLKTFKRSKIQEMAEVETEIDPIVEAETIQETITGMEVEITTIEIEAEIVETTVEIDIEIEAEEETDLIPEKEKEINLDLDQVKDTFTEMNSAIIATDLVIQHITALYWRTL